MKIAHEIDVYALMKLMYMLSLSLYVTFSCGPIHSVQPIVLHEI